VGKFSIHFSCFIISTKFSDDGEIAAKIYRISRGNFRKQLLAPRVTFFYSYNKREKKILMMILINRGGVFVDDEFRALMKGNFHLVFTTKTREKFDFSNMAVSRS
jgi:hypothetical protein